jgi:hypothetical protein
MEMEGGILLAEVFLAMFKDWEVSMRFHTLERSVQSKSYFIIEQLMANSKRSAGLDR